jgi:hypothetical protein
MQTYNYVCSHGISHRKFRWIKTCHYTSTIEFYSQEYRVIFNSKSWCTDRQSPQHEYKFYCLLNRCHLSFLILRRFNLFCYLTNTRSTYSFISSIPVAMQSKLWVCGRNFVGIADSSHAGGIHLFIHSPLNPLYRRQIHIRVNKLIEYRIGNQIIKKYTIYMPYQSIRHTDKGSYKYNMRNYLYIII